MHGRSEGLGFDYPYLDIDNEAAFHDAARLLVQLGHRRIALVNDEVTKTFAIHRERGATAGARRKRAGACAAICVLGRR